MLGPAAPDPAQDELDLDPLPATDETEQSMSPYLRRIALVRPGLRNRACSCSCGAQVAGLGSLLFGYDTGIVSSALIAIEDSLGGQRLTTGEEELVVTATTLGGKL
jgi:hypothetical protein